MSEPRELELFVSAWPSLRPHFTRGAIFVVAPALDLKKVCEALASDDKALVEKWLELNQLRRPTEQEDEQWSKSSSMEFQFGIVQPYVLIQIVDISRH